MNGELRSQIKTLQALAKPLGAVLTERTDEYMEDWYVITYKGKEYNCGTNEYSVKSWFMGFIAGKN